MWAEEQRDRCPDCGTSSWEWDENENAWYADTWRCFGCERKAALRRMVNDELEEANPSVMDGLQIALFRTPPKPREE